MSGATASKVPGFDFASMVNPIAGIAGQALSGMLSPGPSNAESAYTGGNVNVAVGGFKSAESGVTNSSADSSLDSGGGGGLLGVAGGSDIGARIIQGILITFGAGLLWQYFKRAK